jgi:serine-type D-Ala-D-Ala carboxypeptidase (penicillin-binding protein 5/6)
VRRPALLLSLLAALALAFAPGAQAEAPPSVKARAVLVVDASSGEVLHARNPDRRLPMASITKIMTALLTLERAEPDDVVTVADSAPAIGESTTHLWPGERLRVRDLLAAALVQSANDAAFALAAHVGGSVERFVRLMNRRARELGLEDTRYVRPDGLDVPGHYSSASDSLRLAQAAMEHGLVRRIVKQRDPRIGGGRVLHTWNDLLRTFPGTIGVKTGHTDAAGWSQVAAVTRDGVTIYAVVLGGPTRTRRNADLVALLEWAFGEFGRVALVEAGRRYATAGMPFSDERLGLVAVRGASAVVRLGRPLVERVVVPAVVELPVERGERLGHIVVTDRGHVVARRPLVAARTIEEPGFGERVRWYAGRAADEMGDMLAAVLPGT